MKILVCLFFYSKLVVQLNLFSILRHWFQWKGFPIWSNRLLPDCDPLSLLRVLDILEDMSAGHKNLKNCPLKFLRLQKRSQELPFSTSHCAEQIKDKVSTALRPLSKLQFKMWIFSIFFLLKLQFKMWFFQFVFFKLQFKMWNFVINCFQNTIQNIQCCPKKCLQITIQNGKFAQKRCTTATLSSC